MWVDAHAHLHASQFDGDRLGTIARAREAGVMAIVETGVDLETSRRAVELAEENPEVFAAVGIHPHHVETWSDDAMERLSRLAAHANVVAIGEVGLDYYRSTALRDVQRRALRQQLHLAVSLDKPAVLHHREAEDDLIDLVEEAGPGLRGLFHAFSGDRRWLKRCLDTGLFISVAGPVTFPKAEDLRAAVALCPRDRLLIETDSPYLAPQSHRGHRNEPSYIGEIAGAIADLWDTEPESVGDLTRENLWRLMAVEPAAEVGAL